MIPRPPRSTLFPYTTPFRSVVGAEVHDLAPRAVGFRRVPRDADPGALRRDDHPLALLEPRLPDLGERLRVDLLRRDRKSTRLNSSHLGISYAVFCLKKKTQR